LHIDPSVQVGLKNLKETNIVKSTIPCKLSLYAHENQIYWYGRSLLVSKILIHKCYINLVFSVYERGGQQSKELALCCHQASGKKDISPILENGIVSTIKLQKIGGHDKQKRGSIL